MMFKFGYKEADSYIIKVSYSTDSLCKLIPQLPEKRIEFTFSTTDIERHTVTPIPFLLCFFTGKGRLHIFVK